MFATWIRSLESNDNRTSENAETFRESGNGECVSNNFSEANKLYTKSIFASPSQDLRALAHANRAQALMGLGYYKEALDDCQMAILLGYPEDKRAKIFLREGTCAVKTNDRKKLISTIANLEKYADKPNVPVKCEVFGFLVIVFYFFLFFPVSEFKIKLKAMKDDDSLLLTATELKQTARFQRIFEKCSKKKLLEYVYKNN